MLNEPHNDAMELMIVRNAAVIGIELKAILWPRSTREFHERRVKVKPQAISNVLNKSITRSSSRPVIQTKLSHRVDVEHDEKIDGAALVLKPVLPDIPSTANMPSLRKRGRPVGSKTRFTPSAIKAALKRSKSDVADQNIDQAVTESSSSESSASESSDFVRVLQRHWATWTDDDMCKLIRLRCIDRLSFADVAKRLNRTAVACKAKIRKLRGEYVNEVIMKIENKNSKKIDQAKMKKRQQILIDASDGDLSSGDESSEDDIVIAKMTPAPMVLTISADSTHSPN